MDARSALLVAAGAATKGRFWEWVPASYAKLEQAERRILERAIPAPFEMTKVAQLGTVVVPCSDEAKRASGEARNLVMIHGFAGGNAVWAMVRRWLMWPVGWMQRLTFDCVDTESTEPRGARQALQCGTKMQPSIMKQRSRWTHGRLRVCGCLQYAVEWIGVGRSDRPDFNYNDVSALLCSSILKNRS